MKDPWIVASMTYPKHSTESYNYCEWRLESKEGVGFATKKSAIKEAIEIRKGACLFMNWGSDDEDDAALSRYEWCTYECAEQNYDDDEEQAIMVMKLSEYKEKKRGH